MVTRWLAGRPVAATAGSTALARKLVAAGMVHPEPPPAGADPDLTVVIPVRDDPAGLATTLAGLGSLPAVVVDDGSRVPVELTSDEPLGPASRRSLVRRETSGGPAAARQQGLAAVGGALVAFVDAGVTAGEGELRALSRWFADPEVVAVAPRVAATPGPRRLDAYEQLRSPLDMGTGPSLVGPGRPVPYVPTACLLARVGDVRAAGGFDPSLRWGEDVDLVWRLLDRGQVRYDPSIVVRHPPRRSLPAFCAQRLGYGSAAGPLAARHGSELAPLRTSGWSLLCWGLALAGRPGAAGAVAAGTAAALARKLGPAMPDGRAEAVLLTARGHWWAGRTVARASVRDWWPLSLLAFAAGFRRQVGFLVAAAWIDRIARTPGRPEARAWDWLLGVVDDLAYGTGVWVGALRQRSIRCLLPSLGAGRIERPGDGPGPTGR
jgi:mycofactocin system glycosyltransferase